MNEPIPPPSAWQRLGQLLIQRRVALGYNRRPDFIRDAGLKHSRIVASLENAERTNYDDATKAQYEIAYRWQPGSIDRVLAGGEPEEYEPRGTARRALQPLFDHSNWAQRILTETEAPTVAWPADVPQDNYDAVKAEYDALCAQFIQTANQMTRLEQQIRSMALTRSKLQALIEMFEDQLLELQMSEERAARQSLQPKGVPSASDEGA